MKISYVTRYDALDVHNWSGLGYFIARSLEGQHVDIDYVGGLQQYVSLSTRLKAKLYRLAGKNFYPDRDPAFANHLALEIRRRISKDSSVIFSPGTVPIALLKTDKPKVFYTDATFAGMVGYYESFTRLSRETIKNGNYLEQQALDTSALAIYASDWAARTAIESYSVDPTKVKVIPFGANIQTSRSLADIRELVKQRSSTECSLLFLGVDWVRKGGDIAVATAKKLNEAGLKTTLHIAGIKDLPIDPLPDFIINHGFISKSSQAGEDKINQLIAESHFLLLPTRAEAYGLVFCEANSFGVPCLAPAVGGIPTIIKDNLNGKTFALSAGAEEYASYILSSFSDRHTYEELCYCSFGEFERRLNWKVAGEAIVKLLKDI